MSVEIGVENQRSLDDGLGHCRGIALFRQAYANAPAATNCNPAQLPLLRPITAPHHRQAWLWREYPGVLGYSAALQRRLELLSWVSRLSFHDAAMWIGFRRCLLLVACLWLCFFGLPSPVLARDLSRQTPQDKVVELGTADGQLVFVPKELSFRNGSLYRLHLSNPSPLKHYFSAKDFADAVWTRKLEVAGVEIKGQIREIELKPGASVEWQFIPLKSGGYSLMCTIPGHAEAGMLGQITIGD